jgi:hypothetical protein
MRKGIVALCGMGVGLVLIIVAFLGPWYVMNGSGAFGVDYNVGLYLTRMDAKGTLAGQDISLSMSYADAKVYAGNTGVNIESFAVIDMAMYLTVLSMVTACVAVLGIGAFVFQKGNPKTMKLIGGVFVLVTFILSLVPALYVMSTGFSENQTGFWFSQSVLGVTVTGGPGYAWYLMIVAAVIAVICAGAMLVKKIVPETLPIE